MMMKYLDLLRKRSAMSTAPDCKINSVPPKSIPLHPKPLTLNRISSRHPMNLIVQGGFIGTGVCINQSLA